MIAFIIVFVRKKARSLRAVRFNTMFHFEELARRVLPRNPLIGFLTAETSTGSFPPIFLIYGRQKSFAFCGKRPKALPLETITFEKVDEILFVASLRLPEALGFAFHTRKRALGVDGFIRRADDFTGIDELFNAGGRSSRRFWRRRKWAYTAPSANRACCK